ncbi:MAG: hypothetical protein OXH04_07720 [Acidobacteria bacterium]|nr:hypothetical protein [Acidobacteriota bacterium]
MTLVSVLAPVASAQQAKSPEPLTGDPAIDAWVRTTFQIGSSSVSESTG